MQEVQFHLATVPRLIAIYPCLETKKSLSLSPEKIINKEMALLAY